MTVTLTPPAAPRRLPLAAAACAAAGLALMLLSLVLAADAWAAAYGTDQQQNGEWRLRIREAAVANGNMVLLGDIAEPYGPLPEHQWQQLAARPLWPAPPEAGKPLQISKSRLIPALRERLGDLADRCLLPNSLAIQRGGAVWYEDDIRSLIVKTLSPTFNVLPGRVDMTDFRLPAYIFLAHAGQAVQVEPVKPAAGRISFRFIVAEVDGSVARRFSGSAFLNVWAEVACTAKAYNRGDILTPEGVTWISKNLAHIRGDFWDGRGGPWQVIRNIGAGQPIFLTDIEPQSAMRKGTIVTLVYNKGSVRVTAQAEALSDGSLGQTIPVRNLQSKKQVFAVIRDSSTVEVK